MENEQFKTNEVASSSGEMASTRAAVAPGAFAARCARSARIGYTLIGIATVAALIIAVWWFFPMSSAHKISSSTPAASTTQAATPNIQALKTYTNAKYGFSFQYPADMSVALVKNESTINKPLAIYKVYDTHYSPHFGSTLREIRFVVYPYSASTLHTLQQLNNYPELLPMMAILNPTIAMNASTNSYFVTTLYNSKYIITVLAMDHIYLAEQILATFRGDKFVAQADAEFIGPVQGGQSINSLASSTWTSLIQIIVGYKYGHTSHKNSSGIGPYRFSPLFILKKVGWTAGEHGIYPTSIKQAVAALPLYYSVYTNNFLQQIAAAHITYVYKSNGTNFTLCVTSPGEAQKCQTEKKILARVASDNNKSGNDPVSYLTYYPPDQTSTDKPPLAIYPRNSVACTATR